MIGWRRFARFNAVGALGIVVQLTAVWLLVDICRLPYLPATMAAVSAALVHNFAWHRVWTWRDRRLVGRATLAAFTRFTLTNGVVSFVGNAAIMSLLVGAVGLPAVPSNLAAIAACGLLNFWLGDKVVFVPGRPAASRVSNHLSKELHHEAVKS